MSIIKKRQQGVATFWSHGEEWFSSSSKEGKDEVAESHFLSPETDIPFSEGNSSLLCFLLNLNATKS